MDTAALDPRRNAYRADLAAEALRGKVSAPRYAVGEARQVIDAAVPLRDTPDPHARWITEALFGERVTVYDESEGWAWVQLAGDGYVGYLPDAALSTSVRPATHRVQVLGTCLYLAADFKSPPCLPLSMNAALCVAETRPAFARLADGRFVPTPHIAERDRFAPDFVAIAEAFLGVPYVWGGKTRLGVDCSGLLQVAMHAAGLTCPRDSDMQLAELGETLAVGADLAGLARGDLVFWLGHVGIMLDAVRLLHANAHHMAVAIEPLRVAVDRIAKSGSLVTAVKRSRGVRPLASQVPDRSRG
jgi:cell wall-associated NlpC family hydrolase